MLSRFVCYLLPYRLRPLTNPIRQSHTPCYNIAAPRPNAPSAPIIRGYPYFTDAFFTSSFSLSLHILDSSPPRAALLLLLIIRAHNLAIMTPETRKPKQPPPKCPLFTPQTRRGSPLTHKEAKGQQAYTHTRASRSVSALFTYSRLPPAPPPARAPPFHQTFHSIPVHQFHAPPPPSCVLGEPHLRDALLVRHAKVEDRVAHADPAA